MGPVAIIAGIGAAVSAVGTVKSIQSQKKQVKLQKQANKAQRQQDNLRAVRERREAIRTARISSANSSQMAVNQGAADTSASLGALGSIQSQVNQGLSFLDQFNALSDQASVALGKANQAGMSAQVWGAVADAGMKVSQNAGSIGGMFGAKK